MGNYLGNRARLDTVKEFIQNNIYRYIGIKIGVIVHGHKYDPYATTNCGHVELIIPVESYYTRESELMKNIEFIQNVYPRGYSQIANAIEKSKEVLSKDEENRIILITDGKEEHCPGNASHPRRPEDAGSGSRDTEPS